MQKLALAFSLCTLALWAAPVIAPSGIRNAASYSDPAFLNGAIAQGSLFVIFGSGMGPDATVNVMVNGTTLACSVLYASDGQIAVVMPVDAPAGTGNLVVSSGGESASSPITVVEASPGIFTTNQQGTGPGIIQDADGNQNALTMAFNPGQTVVAWATGLGTASGAAVTAFVQGQSATVVYAGPSRDSGVDQVNITLPNGVAGCYVPLYIVATLPDGPPVASNFVTISIAPDGSFCTDDNFPDVTSSAGYYTGNVTLTASTNGASATGAFVVYSPTALATVGSFGFMDIPDGNCGVMQSNGGGAGPAPTYLDAGPTLNISGPNGARQMAKSNGTYSAGLPANYLVPGGYAITNGNGGADVGDFELDITMPPAFTWTEAASISTIVRSQPLAITWSGGDPNGRVQIAGTSIADPDLNASVSFLCIAKGSDLHFTVPAAILSLLPGAGGSLTVSSTTSVTGAVSGLQNLTGSVAYSFSAGVYFP